MWKKFCGLGREEKMKNFMTEQLVQVFEYAELVKRLNGVLELLNPNGGYFGEKEIYNKIEELKETVYIQMKQHLENSQVSETAMIIINNNIVRRR